MQVRKIWYEILVIHAMSFSKRGDSDESYSVLRIPARKSRAR